MSEKESKIVCLMGPTGCGKTAVAMALYKMLPCDIISVDSALVYKQMNVGTAKPTAAELAAAPHRLIDLLDPTDSFSAGQFCEQALIHIEEILKVNRLPLLVGGTMLYFNRLIKGVADLPAADSAVRQAIAQEAQQQGWAALHEQLKKLDPDASARIHPNDTQRISRALEIYRLTGKPITQLQQQTQTQLPYDVISLIIQPQDRQLLHERIQRRLDAMFANGFVEEVRSLYQRAEIHERLPSMRCVGYRQVWGYLNGEYNYETMVHKAVCATRGLAKRQLTWLRQWPNAQRFAMEDPNLIASIFAYLQQREVV